MSDQTKRSWQDKMDFLAHGEMQLLDWGESRTTGPWIKMRFASPDALDAFRGFSPKTCPVLHVTIATGDIAELALEQEQPKLYGQHARKLKMSNFVVGPPVILHIGTDEQYRRWCWAQPCIVCGGQDLVEATGDMVCEAAHVRRAGESGTAYKGKYRTVPLCHKHHQLQHQQGEVACYEEIAVAREWKLAESPTAREESAKRWFDEQLDAHRERWAWAALKSHLGYEHWNEVPPELLWNWAVEHGVSGYVPSIYGEQS